MSSPKRDRGSPMRKRLPDLVSTRRDFYDYRPTGDRGRGRRPYIRRPYGGRRPRGRAMFHRGPNRYYQGHQRRDNSSYKRSSYHRRSSSRSRSRSYGHHRSRSRSRSQEIGSRQRRSRSSSTSSSSSRKSDRDQSRRKSRSKDIQRSKIQTPNKVKLSHLSRQEGSNSPDANVPLKKKRMAGTESPEDSRKLKEKEIAEGQDVTTHGNTKVRGDNADEDFPQQSGRRDRRYRSWSRSQSSSMSDSRSRSRSSSVNEPDANPVQAESKASKETYAEKKVSSSVKGKLPVPRNQLHNLFSLITKDAAFLLEEDISIAIQRNPFAEPSDESTVRKVFDEELFAMIRNTGEGQKPIFDREEIKIFGHDSNLADDPDFERRVIRLKPAKSSTQTEAGSGSNLAGNQRYRSYLGITRVISRGKEKSSSRSLSRSRSRSPRHRKEPEVKLKMLPDPRYEAKYSEGHRKSYRSDLDPDDLAHMLESSRSRPTDLRQQEDQPREDRRRGSVEKGRQSKDYKSEGKKEGESLPDFSRRKDFWGGPCCYPILSHTDKYQYAEWMDKPEMIPKNPSYYEHDNRDEWQPFKDRGRGRGFRGRIINRRPFRPFRGYRGNSRGGFVRDSNSGGGSRGDLPSTDYQAQKSGSYSHPRPRYDGNNDGD
ncbi:serine/arginine-rich splicing factor 4-like isoform X4 [Pomacea canaliculata]|uniref:serine/arginine-rich splicing factor 4-like isoform X4 n=1 Tax=Pomacea canaliculata TaxID=400727 RepID=UPI000D7273A1|nr:serine/arginine-rich splicing factor 4-like isoform X4 [Pomacea canaliculata]